MFLEYITYIDVAEIGYNVNVDVEWEPDAEKKIYFDYFVFIYYLPRNLIMEMCGIVLKAYPLSALSGTHHTELI